MNLIMFIFYEVEIQDTEVKRKLHHNYSSGELKSTGEQFRLPASHNHFFEEIPGHHSRGN